MDDNKYSNYGIISHLRIYSYSCLSDLYIGTTKFYKIHNTFNRIFRHFTYKYFQKVQINFVLDLIGI